MTAIRHIELGERRACVPYSAHSRHVSTDTQRADRAVYTQER